MALLVAEVGRADALAMIDRFEVEDAATVTACPGAAALLAHLPGTAWAVVTSGVRALAEARLAAAGLLRPAVLVTADDVAEGKPAPEGYRNAAALLGVPVADCVVLEDSTAGVAAGRAAGARVVGVSSRARAPTPTSSSGICARCGSTGPHCTSRPTQCCPAKVLSGRCGSTGPGR